MYDLFVVKPMTLTAPESMSAWKKLSWVLANIATTSALLITILYFALVYAHDDEGLTYLNFFMHAMNVLIMYSDLFVSGMTKLLLLC